MNADLARYLSNMNGILVALAVLAAIFGLLLLFHVLFRPNAVQFTMRNASIGGVLGKYEVSNALTVAVCYVLTLAVLAVVAFRVTGMAARGNAAIGGGAPHPTDLAVHVQQGVSVNSTQAPPNGK